MGGHLALWVMVRSLRIGQSNGLVTEGSLINAAKFFWYDGYESFNTDH